MKMETFSQSPHKVRRPCENKDENGNLRSNAVLGPKGRLRTVDAGTIGKWDAGTIKEK